jgi:predicted GTPase
MTDTVSISLVSHTNVGKTTLARTLLGRDVGEVRDEARVSRRARERCARARTRPARDSARRAVFGALPRRA